MAYFAELEPQTNKVLNVIAAPSRVWCEYHLGGTWVETYKDTQGKRYAAIGETYYPDIENFAADKPYPSWVLDDECMWQPPVPRPEGEYTWNEETQSWEQQEVVP